MKTLRYIPLYIVLLIPALSFNHPNDTAKQFKERVAAQKLYRDYCASSERRYAEETHNILKLELLNRQSSQELVKKVRNISGSLAAVGLLVGLWRVAFLSEKAGCHTTQYCTYILRTENLDTFKTLAVHAYRIFLYAGEYLPYTAALTLAAYLYGNDNEEAIQKLQKTLDESA